MASVPRLPVPNYFEATPAVALATGVGGLQAGVSLTAPAPDIAPVVLFMIDGIPMVDYDNPDSSCGLLPGRGPHHAQPGDRHAARVLRSSCATEVNAVPPGSSVHVITDFSWNYTAGSPWCHTGDGAGRQEGRVREGAAASPARATSAGRGGRPRVQGNKEGDRTGRRRGEPAAAGAGGGRAPGTAECRRTLK